MTQTLRKGSAIVLTVLVLAIAVMALLHIWEVYTFDRWAYKTFGSLVVVFITSGVLLFIFAVFFKPDETSRGRKSPPPGGTGGSI